MPGESGHRKEKDIECGLEFPQLEESTMYVAPVDSEENGKAGLATAFPEVERHEEAWQHTNVDVDGEWKEIFEWQEWECDGSLNQGSSDLLLSEPGFQLPYPSLERQIIEPHAKNFGNTEKSLKNDVGIVAFGKQEANILRDTILPSQVENTSSSRYTTGLPCNFVGLGNVHEQKRTALDLEVNPQSIKYREEHHSGMPLDIYISHSFAEHLPPTKREYNDQPVIPAALSSVQTQPTTVAGPPFICTYKNCGRPYGRLAELQRHQKAHGGNRVFCNILGCRRAAVGFVRKDNLRSHMRRKHGVATHGAKS